MISVQVSVLSLSAPRLLLPPSRTRSLMPCLFVSCALNALVSLISTEEEEEERRCMLGISVADRYSAHRGRHEKTSYPLMHQFVALCLKSVWPFFVCVLPLPSDLKH